MTIKQYNQITEKERKLIRKIIENSFNKKLTNNYFNSKFEFIILDRFKRGVIIIKKHYSAYYIDKFAVINKFQKLGIGKSLFKKALEISKGKLFWRCNPKNPVKRWYFEIVSKNNGGFFENKRWIVFWTNLKNSEIKKCVMYAIKKEKTLISCNNLLRRTFIKQPL